MYSIHDEEKVKEFFIKNKISNFRYSQIENAIYKNNIDKFEDIQNIPKDIRKLLNDNFFCESMKIDQIVTSSNGQTTKIIFKTIFNDFVESVIIRHLTGRNTLCVSSQIGCPMKCVFCTTGRFGFKRNLEFYEIIEQIMFVKKLLYKEGNILRNVVYMGMGEPFLNYNNVKKSINIICSQKKINLSNRRITISTCGIIPGILEFSEDFQQVSLAVSLHAPNNEIRNILMPVNNIYPLDKLMPVIDAYVKKTNKKVFYEYIMLSGINDDIKLAYELGNLLKGRLSHVNFIPYNVGKGIEKTIYKPSDRNIVKKFQKILLDFGIPSTIRTKMGDDINAACGQLAKYI